MLGPDGELGRLLQQGMGEMGLEAPVGLLERLLQYIGLLDKWNRTYNLTAIRDPRAMITRHLLDSLAVMPYIEGPRLADVGTGPGLPGIPLALMCPDHEWILLDSNSKKTRFVTQAVAELGLTNVRVITGRVAELRLESPCNTVISRAFTDIAAFIDGAGHLCRGDGQLLAMKGAAVADELQQLPDGYRAELIPLQVPGLDAQRCIVRITHK
jgi:16S rRNA (guanine527-N7)-methyltransferase